MKDDRLHHKPSFFDFDKFKNKLFSLISRKKEQLEDSDYEPTSDDWESDHEGGEESKHDLQGSVEGTNMRI